MPSPRPSLLQALALKDGLFSQILDPPAQKSGQEKDQGVTALVLSYKPNSRRRLAS